MTQTTLIHLSQKSYDEMSSKIVSLENLLSDARDCLNEETPEDMTHAQAKQMIVNKIARYLRFGDFE